MIFCSFFIKSDLCYKHKIFSRSYTEEGIDEGVATSAAHGEPVTAEEQRFDNPGSVEKSR